MHPSRASIRCSWLLAALIALGAAVPARAATTLPGFAVENAFPGVHFNLPTAIAFLPDGRLLVAEKRGVVWVVEGGVLRTKPLWSAEKEVLANGDRGLIGLTVDPDYTHNHRVYFYYTVDPDSNGVDTEGGAFTRLTRYTTSAVDSNVVDSTSRYVLIGRTWASGIPSPSLSHAVDAIGFGTDGSLLVTHGDGSHFEYPDWGGHDPQVFLPGRTDSAEDIGSFRSQYLGSLAGKMLRINPETGHGYASNPYAAGDLTAPRAKVWAYGLRNPFRFTLWPGTGSADTTAGNPGTVYIGDVGATSWEELDVVDAPGRNFGWPCREGDERYATLADVTPAHHGCGSVGDPDNPAAWTAPALWWSHTDSTRSRPYGVRGNCTTGGVFYTATRYPDAYRGRLFFGDYGGGWLRVATVDSTHQVTSMQDFASGLEGPVDWALDPASGELCYVSIYAGEVRRIRYTVGGGATQVIARASATPTVASSPATVAFSSLGSYDTGGADIATTWSFGDGTPGATSAHPLHVYASPGEYAAILTVTRAGGELARDTVSVVVLRDSIVPASPTIDAFDRADGPLAAPWVGNLTGLRVQTQALVQTQTSNYAIWNQVYGANQEVHVRLDSISLAAPEHDLLLKVQGATWTAGAIQVVWDATGSVIAISTYAPGPGWAHIAGPWRNIRFSPGDTFGARAFSNGVLEVYRNDELLGDCRVDTWAFSGSGGRVGLMLKGAAGSRLEDFGGGTLSVRDNVPPVATIVSPADGAFYAEGEPVRLAGAGHDEDDPDSTLRYHWSVSIHHNNHVHPDVMTSDAPVDSFVGDNHDDGTGIELLVKLVVSDARSAADTAQVVVHPRFDLVPVALAVTPAHPDGGPALATFRLVNRGPMPAPRSRWRLWVDGAVAIENDVVVPAHDSIVVQVSLGTVAAGPHVLRAEADVQGAAYETDESNNAIERVWGPLPFPTARVIDAFDRGVGTPLVLGAPWLGSVAGLVVRDLALTQATPTSYAVWNGARFGPDQEAFVRFDSVTVGAPEHSLLLKVQRTTWNGGALQVAYSAANGSVSIYTFAPTTGWVRRGGPWRGVGFAPGDQLGARATAAGVVTAFKNGVAIGTTSLGDWECASAGGRVGLMLRGASLTRLVDFGGGDVVDSERSPPHGEIVTPAMDQVVPAGDTLRLVARGWDAEDDSTSLRYRWRVEFPGAVTVRAGNGAACAIPAPPGPATVRLVVTDPTGRCDTTATTVQIGAGVLDRFTRADGPPGSNWFGSASAYALRDSALVLNAAGGYLTWTAGTFGTTQEAWMEFDSVATSAPEHDLLLKVQGPSWSAGALQVTYSAPLAQVVVNTYAPGAGWTRRAGPWRGVAFAPGDRLGARAYPDGRVRVLKNGNAVGEGSVVPWTFAGNGGRIGLILNGAAGTRISRFGGGDFADTVASILVAERGAHEAAAGGPYDPALSMSRVPRLSAAMPNPVSRSAHFILELPRPARVGLAVFDIAGREVWREPARRVEAGAWDLIWPGSDLRGLAAPGGVYVARVTVDGTAFQRRLTIIR